MASNSRNETVIDIEAIEEYSDLSSDQQCKGKKTCTVESIWQHKLPSAQLLGHLKTDAIHGLGMVDAEKRLLKFGPNILTPPARTPLWKKFLAQFTDMFSLLLQFAAILCFIAFAIEPKESLHLYLGLIIYAVVIVTSFFSFLQQYKSDETLREFRNFLPPKATVLRDSGDVYIIDAAQLVIGDIVRLRLGDKVPADIRILESNRFMVDNSSLTGESEPVELNSEISSAPPLEAANLAFFGCLAIDGSAKGVVVSTGDDTVFGQIAKLTANSEEDAKPTTLQVDIHHFVVSISIFALLAGLLFFTVGIFQETGFIRNIVYSIGIIVSYIPEGLIATVTVALTASARRMANKNVLVKQLDAVESLGSTTVICTDKTGTLTQNRMSLAHIACGGRIEEITSTWVPPIQRTHETDEREQRTLQCMQVLIENASLCSTAVFDHSDMLSHPHKPINQRLVCGDASEAGILRFTDAIHDVATFRKENPVKAIISFNSKNKYMTTVHQTPDSQFVLRVIMKGAPEKILPKCNELLSRNGVRALTSQDRQLIEKQMEHFVTRGERVLGYAEKYLSPQQSALILSEHGSAPDLDSIPTEDFCFVGLLALIDPPRQKVPYAVQLCKNAGIKVIMITGDHPGTAKSIAQEVGIITRQVALNSLSPTETDQAVVITGSDLNTFDEHQWKKTLGHPEIVFARTSPQQKLEIVRNLQMMGEVVTVTGDGCNDAPALRQGNTGVAMGISGSEVAREAANMVLLDDNFASIVQGVEEGRLVFDNLKKSIAYTLTSNVPQLVPFLVFLLLKIPLPVTTVLILCIDLGTDIFPAIALAYEKPESNIMQRPPRDAKTDRLLSRKLTSYSTLQLGMIQTLAGFFAYFAVMSDYGFAPQTLPFIDSKFYFGALHPLNQRWMVSIQEQARGIAHQALWFTKATPKFSKYFQGKQKGFLKQEQEVFGRLPRSNGLDAKGDHAQFNNMIKIVALETAKPPCAAFTCKLSNNSKLVVKNNMACFDLSFNQGPVALSKEGNRLLNAGVKHGGGPGEGCFDLRTPGMEREALRHAQTAFFVAIVVAQMFTAFACKTRILSVFQQGIRNSVLMIALSFEILVALILVYTPALRQAFDVRPLHWSHWFLSVPFGAFILAYDECRKWFIRRHIINESGMVIPGRTWADKAARWVHDRTLW